MMSQFLATVLTHPLFVSASTFFADEYDYGSDEGGFWLWLIGPAGGFGFYMWVFLRYRNTNKRHAYEHESIIELRDLRTHDQKVNHISGTSESSIRGRNSHQPLNRLGSGSTVTVIPEPKPPVIHDSTPDSVGETQENPAPPVNPDK